MDTKVLQEIGLAEAEIKVYLALLRIGLNKGGAIIKEAKLSNSSVYRSLDSLIEKGLISFITKNNVKHFQATDPKNLLKMIDDKRNKIAELIPSLTKRYEETKQEAKVYEGYKGVTTAYEEGLNELSKGEESLFFSIGEEDFSDENIQIFFMNLANKRKERGVKSRGIALSRTKAIFQKYPTKMNMRYTDLKLPIGVSIYKTKIIIISWKDKPTAIVIKSQNIADSYKAFFEEIWKLAKK